MKKLIIGIIELVLGVLAIYSEEYIVTGTIIGTIKFVIGMDYLLTIVLRIMSIACLVRSLDNISDAFSGQH